MASTSINANFVPVDSESETVRVYIILHLRKEYYLYLRAKTDHKVLNYIDESSVIISSVYYYHNTDTLD